MNNKIENSLIAAIHRFQDFWGMLAVILCLCAVSIVCQFSSTGAVINVTLIKHILKLLLAIMIILGVSQIDKSFWMSNAYLFFFITLALLLFVHIFGATRMGAQRWVDLKLFSLQPSELMKLSVILALARYYSSFSSTEHISFKNHLIPLLIICIPVILILKQPDLGTALLMMCVGLSIVYLAGYPIKHFIYGLLGLLIIAPFIWKNLRPYQQSRILTFIDPDRDPLGSGYHILQSKIAIGSGGLFGKGYFNGTQSGLNFLPEKSTDFIFTMLTEETGLIGGISVIILFTILILMLLRCSASCKNQFGKYICAGTGCLIFFHTFINISMVLGLAPVVGVPLLFISYGGSSLVTCSVAIGISIACMQKRKTEFKF